MKRTVSLSLFAVVISAGLVSLPAHAISEAYRAKLERSGCTQLTDGNGCDIHKTKAQNFAHQHPAPLPDASQSEADVRHGKVDPQVARSVQAEILPKVRGKYLGQAVDVMIAQGWRQVGQEGVKWAKAGFNAFLNQDGSSGKVVGVTID